MKAAGIEPRVMVPGRSLAASNEGVESARHDLLGRAVSVPALELRDSTLEASDLHLVAHAAPTERPSRAEPAVEVLKLAASGIEFTIGWRVH